MLEEEDKPCWLFRGGIDEVAFCDEFLHDYPMICVNGAFYTEDGRIRDETLLRRWIYDKIAPWVASSLARKVDALVAAMRLRYRGELRQDATRIQLSNGIFDLFNGFIPRKELCRYRFPVAYNENAPEPVQWLKFLEELLEPEDILTLQEYMGYCLIPTTVAQKMLIIIGRGGEGKSRIGIVLRALLGDNMSTGSLNKVEVDRFARADLEGLLLFVDDDLKMEALAQTNHIKAIITAEVPMDLERKGVQSYQGELTVRFLAFGNGSLQALHDRSHGFFRRQIILTTKERPADRVDDPFLGTRLKGEAEGILLWALAGLWRLAGQDFRFTISQKARENMRQSMAVGNSVVDFMESEGYFRFDPLESATTRQLYRAYRDWCEDNMAVPLGPRAFSNFLCQNGCDYGLERSNTIPIGQGKRARGFLGIKVCPRV